MKRRNKRLEGAVTPPNLIIRKSKVIITSPLIIKSSYRTIAEVSISKICLRNLYDYDSKRTLKGLALKNFLKQFEFDGIEVCINE